MRERNLIGLAGALALMAAIPTRPENLSRHIRDTAPKPKRKHKRKFKGSKAAKKASRPHDR